MERLITWFNDTAPSGNRPLQALLRAGIAHLYFVSIPPSRTAMAGLRGRLPKKHWPNAWDNRRSSRLPPPSNERYPPIRHE
ncbi:hypothetical protein [Methylomicrobium sp. Wu6]|uniref:hypothetical protein n=1 Tax=Methylomicrobium sp. Wu6 TaxID=3107928 RepID=UPI002DD63CB4|nr:hypothetical protein [Methylomicrobium sp. Wu6]MEC4747279.1 hypothetical protein [Methylomicrobium sp. Wu6]